MTCGAGSPPARGARHADADGGYPVFDALRVLVHLLRVLASNAAGDVWPSALCRRRGLYQPSM